MATNLATRIGIAAGIATMLGVLGTGVAWDVKEHIALEQRFNQIEQEQQKTNSAVRVLAAELATSKQELIERLLDAQLKEKKIDASFDQQLKSAPKFAHQFDSPISADQPAAIPPAEIPEKP